MSYEGATRLCIEIHGAVQGVGFRPFVFRLATALGLTGWVLNDVRGVFIEVEGPPKVVAQFADRLPHELPPRAVIYAIEQVWAAPSGYTSFTIRQSAAQGVRRVLLLPDSAPCADCLREIRDPRDRRFAYPFTNCTNCGPRFTIIEALPYDRPATTMRHFTLCPACQAEYDDPRNRRFHAQPNACPVCGPHLAWWPHGQPAAVADPLRAAADALAAGTLVAVKGMGGFHLMCDARQRAAIEQLRLRKPRRDKPFALMARDLAQVRTICTLSPAEETLLTSPEAPIVLLRRRPNALIAEEVAPDNPYLGVMLPATPLHHLLLAHLAGPVVATSGNRSDEPIAIDEHDAVQRLGPSADHFLVHNRPIARHADDSIVMVLQGAPMLLRRARGYAPLPVLLKTELPCILAVGAHLKNTVALSVGRQVFISQHIGDLETPEALGAFERVIADFLTMYDAHPVALAHDMHPDYRSTIWAREAVAGQLAARLQALIGATVRAIPVQHHHAHLAACLAEHGATEPALGIIWDGTGYGHDGTIWGGECLLGTAASVERVAHLRPFRLPGGTAAIREPRRVALALLWELLGEAAFEQHDLAPLQTSSGSELRLLAQMLERQVHAPLTTSAGRLFDGVAALLGLPQRVTFEGQAAMQLEFLADPNEHGQYEMDVRDAILDWRPTIRALLVDLRKGGDRGCIAARFHNTLVAAIVAMAQQIGVAQVVLSGGCFQNRHLTERAAEQLAHHGFAVLLPRQVPPNDGGISLGQVAVAAATLGLV